jgi:hypothetical protein
MDERVLSSPCSKKEQNTKKILNFSSSITITNRLYVHMLSMIITDDSSSCLRCW